MHRYSNAINRMTIGNIKYRNTVVAGEVMAINDNGTFDIKLAGEGATRPNIPTIFINPSFNVGEMVGVAFEGGIMEMPKIIGGAKKRTQIVNSISYDYV